jgi:tetratricopeptide (TPR) repeat protein
MKSFLLISFIASTYCFGQDGQSILVRKADSLFDAGNWKASAAAYQEILKVNDKDGRIWYRLGETFKSQKLYAKAIEAYLTSRDLKPPQIPRGFINANLAKAYSLNKDSSNALDLLSEMVKNGYANFPDLDTSSEYRWIRTNQRFTKIVEGATNNAAPCLNNPKNKEFDFWVGEWNVYQTGTDYQVGKQKIEKASGGCLVIENWTAVGFPNDGKSMNFIGPKTGKWEQVWMGSGGQYLNYYNGEYRDGAMRYEGDGMDKAGNKLLFHLTYFNLGPDKLRQLLEQSTDSGKTWTTLYDFSYKRLK